MKNHEASSVSLREVSSDNINAVLDLSVASHQQSLVSNNARSIAQAQFQQGLGTGLYTPTKRWWVSFCLSTRTMRTIFTFGDL